MSNTQTQAERIADKFGGPTQLANALGLSPSTVYRWNYPKSKKGSDGIIPTSQLRRVLEAAAARGIVVTAEDLYPKPAVPLFTVTGGQ